MSVPSLAPTIVRLTREDFDAVTHILCESGLEVDLEAELAREFALPWVVRSPGSGEALAFSLAWSVADELHLLDMASHPEHRRKGHARALLSELFGYARQEHKRLLLLEVRRSNESAIRLYRSAGFETTGVRRGYYSDTGEDALEMRVTFDPRTGQILPESGRMTARWFSCTLALSLLASACDDHKGNSGKDAGLTEPSPNASILPAPLASEVPGGAKANGEDSEHRDAGHALADAGADAPPPEPHAVREDQALPSETPHESTGFGLSARLRWLDAAAPVPRVPEQNPDGVQRARDAGAFDVVIDLAGGRMRFAFASRAFTLPASTELHARDDLYGQTLLWPNRTTYTVLPPGTLRSVLSQQRADVVPLVRPRFSALSGGSLFGFSTERVELSTPTGKLELEQVRAPNNLQTATVWASGASLCQLLIELLGASPASSACRADLVPVRAVYTWPNGQHFAFEVSRLARRSDFNPSAFSVPPAGAEFRQSELPPPPPAVLLSDNELSEFRVRPAARTDKPDPSAPKSGLLLVNHSENLRYISVDGAPAARLLPGAEQTLLGLRAGKYQISARDFFDGEELIVKTVEVPARFSLGDDSERAH